MVHIDTIRAANTALANSQPLVAVFVGGTSGIGDYTLRALVDSHSNDGEGLCIYIVGRNQQSADKIISDCKEKCPGGEYTFIQAKDLSLITDCDKAAAEIIRHQQQSKDPRIDLLVMTQGGLYLTARNETTEGIDFAMGMHYYSRARFIHQLLPFMKSSKLPAHVVSVYAGGMEQKLFKDDLSLRQPEHYAFANVRSHCIYMMTMFMQRVANENPGKISLVHNFPGLVVTPGFDLPSLPIWLRITWKIMAPFARFFAVDAEESGQRTLFLATKRFPARGSEAVTGSEGQVGSGAYACGNDGEASPSVQKREKSYEGLQDGKFEQQVWDHTMKAFDDAVSRKVFDG